MKNHVVTALCFAGFALVVALGVATSPRCGPDSPAGPAIGSVVMVSGCRIGAASPVSIASSLSRSVRFEK